MICCQCGKEFDAGAHTAACPHCGGDVRIARKTQYISNYLYNQGLALAKKRRLADAIETLTLSLRYFKKNTQARNLLALCYYERGEIYEAVLEWNISLRLDREGNPAKNYLGYLRRSREQIDESGQFVRKYNQALLYIRQNDLDLAGIQLQNILDADVHMVRAGQLKALLEIRLKRYDRAAAVLEEMLEVDRSDTRTIAYLEECRGFLKKDGSVKERYRADKQRRTLREMYQDFMERMVVSSLATLLLGIVIGAAVLGFLVIPGVRQTQSQANSEALVEANETLTIRNHQIATLEDEIEELQTQLEEQEQATQEAEQSQSETKELYAAVLAAYEYYAGEQYEEALETLKALDTDSLTDDLQETVTALQTQIEEAQDAQAEAEAAEEEAEEQEDAQDSESSGDEADDADTEDE